MSRWEDAFSFSLISDSAFNERDVSEFQRSAQTQNPRVYPRLA